VLAYVMSGSAMIIHAADGLERARLVKPDLILLDVTVPGINSRETCRRLKAMPRPLRS
jgi:CheY-like chemotaxis protein